EKTKEGAEAVGRETKEFFTGDESDKDKRMKSSESESTTQRTNPTETTTRSTETTQSSTTTSKSTSTGSESPGRRRLPATAGELPLLALAGALALVASARLKLN